MPSSFQSSLDANLDWRNAMILYRTENANIPVILTAPHGGPLPLPNQNMTARPLLPGVVTRGDLHTMDLMILIDDYVRRKTSNTKRPHVVAAKFHRQYIDANRNSRIASHAAYHPDCSTAKGYYDQYHNRIDTCIAHSMDSSPFSRALLLDIHGMGPYSDFVIVGTLNGQTCATTGRESVSQPHMGFLWHLRQILGCSVLPLPGSRDFPQYSGGHTVGRHGGGRVDALQLEFGGFLRTAELRQQIAEAVGEAILRTIQPMRIFLLTLASVPSVHWRAVDIPAVEEKLGKARCLTPADIGDRISNINKAFEAQGAKKFSRKTLGIILDMLNNGSSPLPSSEKCLKMPSISSAGKLLPREFVLHCGNRLFTTIRSSETGILSPPVMTEGCLSPWRSVPSADCDLTSTRICTALERKLSFLSSKSPTPPSHQLNIVRRIFICDSGEQFPGGMDQFCVSSKDQRRTHREEASPVTVFRMQGDCEDIESDAHGRDTFSLKDFLSGGDSCVGSLVGFTSDTASSSSSVCRRTGDSSHTVRGLMVTFGDLALFSSKFLQWQQHLEHSAKRGGGASGSKSVLWAVVPVLAAVPSVSRAVETSKGPLPNEDRDKKEAPTGPPGEESVYCTYVRYTERDEDCDVN